MVEILKTHEESLGVALDLYLSLEYKRQNVGSMSFIIYLGKDEGFRNQGDQKWTIFLPLVGWWVDCIHYN